MHETHTPGPWIIVEYEKRESPAASGAHGIFREGAITPLVESVWGATLAESDANARLIAAAPDLLAACSYVLTGLLANGDRDEATIAMCHRLDRVLMQARTVPPIVCATCGEEAGSTGSLSGLVHRWGPVDHPFIPRKD